MLTSVAQIAVLLVGIVFISLIAVFITIRRDPSLRRDSSGSRHSAHRENDATTTASSGKEKFFKVAFSPDPVAEPEPNTPAVVVEDPEAITAEDVKNIRFVTKIRGYDPVDVDAFLEKLQGFMGAPAELTEDELSSLETVRFNTTMGGYDVDEVDAIIDAASKTLHHARRANG